MGKNKILIISFGLIFWVIMVMGSNPRLDLCQQQPLFSMVINTGPIKSGKYSDVVAGYLSRYLCAASLSQYILMFEMNFCQFTLIPKTIEMPFFMNVSNVTCTLHAAQCAKSRGGSVRNQLFLIPPKNVCNREIFLIRFLKSNWVFF